MANLPNKPFVFNYNAKDYDASTHTIPRTSGQTLAQDMVWSGKTSSVVNEITLSDDHISVPMSAYSPFIFSTVASNPLNMGSGNNSMTIVAKIKKTNTSTTPPTDGKNLIANRQSGTWNWMARTGSGYLSFSYSGATDQPDYMAPYSSGSVVTVAYKVDNGTLSIWNLTTNVKSTPISTAYNPGVDRFCFFASLHSGSTNAAVEMMSGDFYWCYASREVLTDEEIQQVVRYNDAKFGLDATGTTALYTGGTSTANIEADTTWSATTVPSWITVSPASGESGTTAITFTIKKNTFSARTGVVVFTDANNNTAQYTVVQGGTDGIVPVEKIYRNERRIN